MAANHPNTVRRGGAGRAPQLLFWGGMALAPIAVLILLFGQSTGALRAAVVLAVLTIVMLAVSMAIRPSVDMVRVDIEHRVLDEMERIRLRSRDESAMAARHTQKAIADHIHALNETIAGLRAQVDEVQSVAYLDPQAPPAIGVGPGGGPPGMRRTETVHVTRRTTYDDTGTLYGSQSAYAAPRAVEGEWQERYEDRGWSADQPEQRALPPAYGSPVADYYDDRDRVRDERYRDDRIRDGYEGDRHRDERYRDDRYRDDRHRDDQYRDDRHRDDRYRDDRHRDDRHRDDQYRDDRHRDDQYRDDQYRDDQYRDDQYRDDRHRDDRHRDRYEGDQYRARFEDDRRVGYGDRGGFDRRGHDRGEYEDRGRDRGYDDRRDRYDGRGREPGYAAGSERERRHSPPPRSPEW